MVPTAWGAFGLVACEETLAASYLPSVAEGECAAAIRRDFPMARENRRILPSLQEEVRAYFAGEKVTFRVRLHFGGASAFARDVLRACRKIPFGKVWTYAELAERASRPGAARAVGRVMSRNRQPLIIPCHRVVAAGGKLGGFSGPQGVSQKQSLLEWEEAI